MTPAHRQFCLAYGGLACTVFSVVACAAGLWTVAAVGFAASAACWSCSQMIANKRRERLGSAIIRKTREVEAHAQTARANLPTSRSRLELEAARLEYDVVEVVARNFRTATTEAIRDA